jgi:hypothetical protein
MFFSKVFADSIGNFLQKYTVFIATDANPAVTP